MNLLAHSVDTLCGSVELEGLLRVTVDLTHRLVQRRNAELEVITPDEPVTVATSSFLLMNLLWLCLDSVMPAGGESRKIRISCERQGNEGVIHISADGPAPQNTSPFPGELIQSVADAIEASLETESNGTGMVIRVPMQPGTSDGNPACTI
ncbi:MAG: hypothetical protein LJE65_07315, partial [Desulfobacteraceae bacterium]|nr:hypothetical protein [Desulfobacteraceae bacterium]